MRHAHELAPLIGRMYAYYADTGSTDEEQEGQQSAFRVGIGSLCGRTSATQVHAVIHAISDEIGWHIPLHIWGGKLNLLRSRLQLRDAVTLDTSSFNGLFGAEHEARRKSSYSEAQYTWLVSQPRYANAIKHALDAPKQQQFLSWKQENGQRVVRRQIALARQAFDAQR